MTEEGKDNGGSWQKVPVWTGNRSEWSGFKRETNWWMASLDAEATKKYNVAAKWTLKQTGIVRARCEEYDPGELAGAASDPFAGLKKLLSSLEDSVGKTELDRRGELRAQFYQEVQRRASERLLRSLSRLAWRAAERGRPAPRHRAGLVLEGPFGLGPAPKAAP